MSRFTLQPMPRSTSLYVRHPDFPRKPVALVVVNGSGTLSLIPVEIGNPPSPLTGETMCFPHLGAVADHLGIAWTSGALAA